MKILLRPSLLILFIQFILSGYNSTQSIRRYVVQGFAQGTTYHITYYAPDSVVTRRMADSIFVAIDSSLSSYKPYSLINSFNKQVRGVIADRHLKTVVQKAITVSLATQGRFDITVAPLVKAWGFGPGAHRPATPLAKDTIQQILKYVGAHKIYFKKDSLIKKHPAITIDINGIAQGYTVDVLYDFLKTKGLTNFIVEVGGELRVMGRRPDNHLMTVAIESPGEDGKTAETRKIALPYGGLTTSGKFFHYYKSGNRVISHLMNPVTGYPVENNIISVTVWAKDAITADAYDNALVCLGVQGALHFLEKQKGLEAYFIYQDKQGNIADTASKGFYKLFID